MASRTNSGGAKDKDKRIASFIAFANEVETRLPSLKDEDEIRYLTNELETQIHNIKSCKLRNAGQHRHEQLDSAGTNVWNLCTRLKRQEDGDTTPAQRNVRIYARVFAFTILTLTQWPDQKAPHDIIRLGKLAIKTARSCIDGNHFEFALFALQKAVDYNGQLQNLQDKLPDEEANACKRLEAEFLMLRTVMGWKEDRLDVAEHTYVKASSLMQSWQSTDAEQFADALYEIGGSLLKRHDYIMAVKWLERAYECLNAQELERLSREAIELRLSISQALIQAFLGLNTPEGIEKAESHAGYLESEMGDRFIILLLRLEILLKSPAEVFDSHAYATVLRRMINMVDISDSPFRLIIHHIRKLDDKSPSLACQLLDELLRIQILRCRKQEWVDKVITVRTYMCTNHRDTPETAKDLRSIFDLIRANTDHPLAAGPALAVLTLLWKKVESAFTNGQVDQAESWCKLAMHPLLENCGPVNTAKIARKLLVCALERNDVEAAQDVFQSMNESIRTEPMTVYLAYKLALRSGEKQRVAECLNLISDSCSKDAKFLYACCVDAESSGDKVCTLEALKHLAAQHEFSTSSPIHLPALLRVIIRLQVSLINDENQKPVDRDTLLNDMCHVFESVTSIIQRDPRDNEGSKIFSVAELNWFCKNAYNLALKYTDNCDLRQVTRLFRACISIVGFYPTDLPAQERGDLSLRSMFCNFMLSTAYVALARSDDNIEARLQYYLEMRKCVKGFDHELEGRLNDLDEHSVQDLQSKLANLLVFDFEGAVHLKNWDDLSTIVRKASACKDLSTLQAMADSLLRAQNAPAQARYSVLRTIINEIWQLERFEMDKLAKYMRCLLQATLSSDALIPLKVMEEISQRAKEASKTDMPFPPTELEWLATTAFNHGLDLYMGNEDELSKKWIDHAFTLAHVHKDGGLLEKELQEKYTHLKWDS